MSFYLISRIGGTGIYPLKRWAADLCIGMTPILRLRGVSTFIPGFSWSGAGGVRDLLTCQILRGHDVGVSTRGSYI